MTTARRRSFHQLPMSARLEVFRRISGAGAKGVPLRILQAVFADFTPRALATRLAELVADDIIEIRDVPKKLGGKVTWKVCFVKEEE